MIGFLGRSVQRDALDHFGNVAVFKAEIGGFGDHGVFDGHVGFWRSFTPRVGSVCPVFQGRHERRVVAVEAEIFSVH